MAGSSSWLFVMAATLAGFISTWNGVVECQGPATVVEVHYLFEEEQPVGTAVGNVVVDASLDELYDDSTLRLLRYRFLKQVGWFVGWMVYNGAFINGWVAGFFSVCISTQHARCAVLNGFVQLCNQIFAGKLSIFASTEARFSAPNAALSDQRIRKGSRLYISKIALKCPVKW